MPQVFSESKLSSLKEGDCLLYRPSGTFGWMIRLKTWHPISHVEVYDGKGFSWASRDGKGVNHYPVRLTELAYVMRPRGSLSLQKSREAAVKMIGTPYGWVDLLQFMGLNIDSKGIVCSPFVVEFYRAGGLDPFPGEDPNKVAPFEFAVNPLFDRVWSDVV